MIDTIILFLALIPFSWGLADMIHILKAKLLGSDSAFEDINIYFAEDYYNLYLKISALRILAHKKTLNVFIIDFSDIPEEILKKCEGMNVLIFNKKDIAKISDLIEGKVGKNAK